jgi:hypothetical protein
MPKPAAAQTQKRHGYEKLRSNMVFDQHKLKYNRKVGMCKRHKIWTALKNKHKQGETRLAHMFLRFARVRRHTAASCCNLRKEETDKNDWRDVHVTGIANTAVHKPSYEQELRKCGYAHLACQPTIRGTLQLGLNVHAVAEPDGKRSSPAIVMMHNTTAFLQGMVSNLRERPPEEH